MFAFAASCTQSCSVFSCIQSLKGIFSRGLFLTHLCFCDRESKVICWPWKQQLTKVLSPRGSSRFKWRPGASWADVYYHRTAEIFNLSAFLATWEQRKQVVKTKLILLLPLKLIWWACVQILAWFGHVTTLSCNWWLIKMSFQFQSLNSEAVLAVMAASVIQMFQRSFTDFFEKRVYSWGQSKLN